MTLNYEKQRNDDKYSYIYQTKEKKNFKKKQKVFGDASLDNGMKID